MDFVGRDDLGGLVDGRTTYIPADDHRATRVMEPLEARLVCRQRPEALARRERGRVGSGHVSSEVSGDKDGLADGRRVVAAGHQVHLGRELTGPGADRPTQVEVVSDALLTVITESDG